MNEFIKLKLDSMFLRGGGEQLHVLYLLKGEDCHFKMLSFIYVTNNNFPSILAVATD
jgi:hypothetical protein